MRKISFITLTTVLAASLFMSCTENMNYKDADVYPVSGLTTPVDGYFIDLRSGLAYLNFEWEPGAVEDGLPPQYELVFMSDANGTEAGRLDAGFKTSLSVTHKELNTLAGSIGIEPGEEGTIYWTVAASRGYKVVNSSVVRKLDVKRLMGFAVIPEFLYLSGSGTEAGADRSNAIRMRTTDDGEYEIYTSLEEGEFILSDSREGDARTYGLLTSTSLQETGSASQVPQAGTYRITADFNTRSISMELIEAVRFMMSEASDELIDLEYIGNGQWYLSNFTPVWIPASYGNDQRYLFRAYIPDVAGGRETWGSVNENNDGTPASQDNVDYRIFVYNTSTVPQINFSHSFKFPTTIIGTPDNPAMMPIDILVDMSPDVEHYIHTIIVR